MNFLLFPVFFMWYLVLLVFKLVLAFVLALGVLFLYVPTILALHKLSGIYPDNSKVN